MDCVDNPATVVPAELLESLTGRTCLWPVKSSELDSDQDAFFDVIEALHDRISRPLSRSIHPTPGCCITTATSHVAPARIWPSG
jgi:hypothetical protein